MVVANGPDVGSPYQKLMREHLLQLGVHLRTFRARTLWPLARTTWSSADILHLDWLHPFYASSDHAKARLKRWLFQTDIMSMRRLPLVWNVHNLISHGSTALEDDKSIRRLLERVNVLISFTEAGAGQIVERWPFIKDETIVTVPHGNFVGFYPDFIEREKARSSLGLPEGARVALFLGRLHRYKGCEELVTSFRRVASKNDWLIVAGEPEDRALENEIRHNAAGHVRILLHLKRINDEELQWYFRAADFCVYPFRNIFNSGAVMLALSFAKPVLAPPTAVLREVAGPEALLPLSPAPNGLEEALERAFGDSLLKEKGLAGYQRVAVHNGWPDVAKKFAMLYEGLIDRG